MISILLIVLATKLGVAIEINTFLRSMSVDLLIAILIVILLK